MKCHCEECDKTVDSKDMIMKMGGLLCPDCRTILLQPYVDDGYFEEMKRREKEKNGITTKTSQ